MNKTYRSIWNETLGTFVAAPEITSANGKKARKTVVAAAAAAVANAWPHCPQNLAPSLHGAAHSGQCCTSGAPQSLQHLAPSRFSVAQAGQFKLMGLPC